MNVEDAKSLKQSSLWDALSKEIDNKVAALKETLVTATQPNVVVLQESIKVLRCVQNMPQDIIEREES